MTERARAERLDADDRLASFRERFVIDDPATIYLDGNSLGRLPLATRARIGELVEQWGAQLVGGWHAWVDLPVRVGDLIAEAVLDARPGEVIVSDSTTVNLYKLAGAVLARREGAIVAHAGEFPTDRYVLAGLAGAHGRELRLFEADPVDGPAAEDVEEACAAGPVALVVLSHVNYRSGAVADIPAVEEAAAVPVIWDLSHSAGVLEPGRIGLAVGCTYKYLNAGPGAPAFLYAREDLQPELRSPIQGWFGQRRQFEMDRDFDPEPGVRRLPRGHPERARAGGDRGGGAARGGGRDRRDSREGRGTHGVSRRAARRMARSRLASSSAARATRVGGALT